jgi:hypothetical protein
MSAKRGRKCRTSSGVRKNRTEKSGRKSPVVADQPALNFLRHQKEHRWPDQETEQKAQELAMKKHPRSRAKSKPMTQGFTMLDALMDNPALDVLLTAASLKLKRVRRYPGYVLQRVYNLKNRPIQII